MGKMIKTKPKLENFIPVLGLKYYVDRCEKDRRECCDLDGRLIAEHIDYTAGMLFYHLMTGSPVLASLGYLLGSALR